MRNHTCLFCANLQLTCSLLLQEDMGDWQVVAYGKTSGTPQQEDSNSCGVFTCVIAKHLVEDRALPQIPCGAKEWRKWIAAALLQESC